MNPWRQTAPIPPRVREPRSADLWPSCSCREQPRLLLPFESNGAREEYVVFQMGMLIHTSLKFFQSGIERLVAETCGLGRSVRRSQHVDGFQSLAGRFMLEFHHVDRIADRSERSDWRGFAGASRLLQFFDVWEQHHLFFHHVSREFIGQTCERPLHGSQLGMTGAMNRYYLEEQLLQARDFLLHVTMMCGKNVSNQVCEQSIFEVRIRPGGFITGRTLAFKTAQHFIYGNVGLPAGILEWLAASTAVVNAEPLKNAGCVRDFGG